MFVLVNFLSSRLQAGIAPFGGDPFFSPSVTRAQRPAAKKGTVSGAKKQRARLHCSVDVGSDGGGGGEGNCSRTCALLASWTFQCSHDPASATLDSEATNLSFRRMDFTVIELYDCFTVTFGGHLCFHLNTTLSEFFVVVCVCLLGGGGGPEKLTR